MTGTPRILLVDDNAAMTAVCCRALKMAGDYEIQEVNSPTQAVQIAQRFRPDLIVLDLVMPEMTGEAVLAAIRSLPELAATQVMILTGRKSLRLALDANTSFVSKPIHIPQLVDIVESIVSSLRKGREHS